MNDDALIEELLPLHALGALEPVDAERVEAYLAGNPAARARFAALLESAAILARAVPPAEPAPELKSRVLARVRAVALEEEATLNAVPEPRAVPEPPRAIPRDPVGETIQSTVRPFTPRPRVLEVILALAAAAAIGGLTVLNLRTSAQLRTLEDAQRRVETLLAAGNTTAAVLNVPGRDTPVGRVYVAADGRALVAYDLGALPRGRTWQLWYIPRGETAPRSLGVTEASSFVAQLPANTQAVAVSEEPTGGSAQPTTVRAIATL